MDNLGIYNALRNPPEEALKRIEAGRMKGKTDINPMWRIKALTEQFGPCGVGWKYIITKQWLESGSNGVVSAFCNIELYYKYQDIWSEAVPGTGGSSFVSKERDSLYVSDECYKMALTDAISVAAKALGVAGDIYWQNDPTKYGRLPDSKLQNEGKGSPVACRGCGIVIEAGRRKDGSIWPTADIITYSSLRFGSPFCPDCMKKMARKEKAKEAGESE